MDTGEADRQLSLTFSKSEKPLQQYLEEHLGRLVSLVLTENSSTMLSSRARDGVLRLRLHRIFMNADDEVLDEIVSYLKNKKAPMPLFRDFVLKNKAKLSVKPPRQIPLKTAGKHHDLREVYDAVNNEYFEGSISATITWGSKSPRHAVRKRTLGSYSERSHTIRINPVLDRKAVPRYFVAFIVYHEMLHAVLGSPVKGTRRSIHCREFKRRERLFREYARAMAWEQGHG